MHRRALLRGVAATATVLPGCATLDGITPSGGDPAGPGSSPSHHDSRPPARRGTFEFAPGDEPPYDSLELGDRSVVTDPGNDLPHRVAIWNDGDTRRLRIDVVGAGVGTLLDTERRFAAGDVLALELQRPDRYTVAVGADGKPQYAFVLGSALFDCNDSGTNVVVRPDGEVRYSTFSTMVACDVSGANATATDEP